MPTYKTQAHHVAVPLMLSLLSLPAVAMDWIYVVVPGDNLWNFSEKYLDSQLRFKQVRKLNNIEFPKKMRPGTRLRIPMKWIRSNSVPTRIKATRGQVTLIRANGSEQETGLSPGTDIRLGDTLRTGRDGSAAMIFADTSVLTLHSDSEIRFDHLSAHGETGMVDSRLRLIKGRMDTRVKPAVGPGSRFEVHTPSAISAVRGTEYRTAVTREGHASNIEVLGGKVQVTGARKQRLIPSGFGIQVALGKAPPAPRKLLSPPQLNLLPQRIRQLNHPLLWRAIARAAAYRVEISADPSFDLLILDQLVDRPRMLLPDLADGDYHIRIRGIDNNGLEGNNSIRKLHFDIHPQPPVLLLPGEGKTLYGERAELVWSDPADVKRFHLQIAADDTFENLVFSRGDLDANRYRTSGALEPGTYYWRVASISADGEVGPPSAVRSWHLKPVPEKVEPSIKHVEDKLVASWPQNGPQQRYQVQLAFNSDFTDLEFDRITPDLSSSFNQINGQVRYLRVRSIEPDGYRGSWGTVQRIDPPPDASAWLFPLIGILGLLLL